MKSTNLNRRSFIGLLGMGILALQLPITACRRRITPSAFEWDENEQDTLQSILAHLWPKAPEIPTLEDANTIAHLKNVLNNPYLIHSKRKILKAGPAWTESEAKRTHGLSFIALNENQKEVVLRNLETKHNGERFLNYLLTFHFEALLGDPEYSINNQQSGWKWLGHIPGYPRPKPSQIYPYDK